ncbi:conjugal transfer protein TraG N-terminal domain-containing protein [Uliginosibacterium gangwonense]|uniref:conjugal transfer protein TraG N-terminal domain-containing protein n=1 Tax=Uliginosibacterium gangwonense TaxID=392736 RepID=UPI0003826E6E|nr:conjugal transfer protein TraG N-terminal domain-containing protein [Uliginosibacterium gangwonense]
MGVESYLELFTTMYGWSFAAVIKDVLLNTGLCFVPLLVIIGRTWLEAHQSRAIDGADAAWMVRKMEVELGCAMVVMTLCFATSPVTSLSQMRLTYTEDATTINPNPTTVNGTNSGSTYGTNGFTSTPATVQVPVFWYAVMGLSSGINEAVKAGIGSNREGYREMAAQLQAVSVSDPQLRAEIQRFQNECFIPARSRYLVAQPPSSAVVSAIKTYGAGDTEWMGSHAFRTDSTLYPALYAQAPVSGWPLDPVQDADVADNDIKPDAGRPNCGQWWSDSSLGLRSKMVSSLDTTSTLVHKFNMITSGVPDEQRQDALAILAVRNTRPDGNSIVSNVGDDRGDKGFFVMSSARVAQILPESLGLVGSVMEGVVASSARVPIIDSISMAQPLILMALYMFMPIALVVGCFSLRVMIAGGLAIFTVKMWPMMWFVARWLDDNLIGSMFPGASNVVDHFFNAPLDATGFQKQAILNVILIGMYLGFPIIWSGMMAWAGHRVLNGIGEMQKSAADKGNVAGRKGVGATGL